MKKRSHKLSLVGTCLVILTITACNSTPGSNTAPEASTSSQPTVSSQPTTSSQPTASSQPPASSQTTTNVYPEMAVQRFTEACAKDRGAKVQALCTCAIKEIQNRYTFDEFRKIVQNAKTSGQPPGEVREILQSCRASNP